MTPVMTGVLWALAQLATVHGATDCGTVFLTVSSLWHHTAEKRPGLMDRELELNWDPACEPEWLGLFDNEPSSDAEAGIEPILRISPIDYPEGFYRTNVSMGRLDYPGGWQRNATISTVIEGDHCFPHWIASYRNNTLLQADCLKIRPTWMWDNRQQLGPMPIGSLFLPGTHNSGCHHKGATLTRRDTFARYLLTQDTDVWGQLVHGIRYLDLRVGYYPLKGKGTGHDQANRFWINHDLIRVGPLLPVLQDIKHFLSTTKGEVVILDFHRFPVGFHGRHGRHRRLVALLNKELGQFIIPSSTASASTTLGQIWSKDRRLIVAYGDNQVARETKWLWSPINQLWGNQQTPGGLRNFLQRCMDSAKQRTENNVLWAAMAELTPTPLEVMFKPSGSLRQMADSINRNITTWFRNLWWQKANIVATDFFLANDLIDVSIAANLRKVNMVES